MTKEKKISSEKVFKGKIVDVCRDTVLLPDGNQGVREVVKSADAVAVVAVTKDLEVLLVKQHRYPTGQQLLEIPAGKIELGEIPLDCAKRELEEETGFRAKSWNEMFRFYTSPGFCTEQIYLFLAQNLEMYEQKLDRDEFIEVVKIPLENALELAEKNEINDAKTIIGFLAAHRIINNK